MRFKHATTLYIGIFRMNMYKKKIGARAYLRWSILLYFKTINDVFQVFHHAW